MDPVGIPSKITHSLRRVRKRLRQWTGASRLAEWRGRLNGHPIRKILIVSDGRSYTSEEQLAPLIRHHQAIAARFGLVFHFTDLSVLDGLASADLNGYYAVGLKLSYQTPADDANAIARKLFEMARAAGAKTLVFDGDDDLCVLWPGVIEASDLYIKKHRFADRAAYARAYVGKSNLTDYVHRTYGVVFEDDIIPGTAPLNNVQRQKITLGWNIALDNKIVDLAKDIDPAALEGPRDIDLLCRASVGSHVWTFDMRDAAVQAIESMRGAFAVHAPTDRVPQDEYYREMLRAKLSVSPFGFGELCWRDFESILCGSLLIKPDMSHLQTWPNLFVPHETYIPVEWDFSDLEAVSRRYLEEDATRLKITSNARARLIEALGQDAFLTRLDSIMAEIASA